MCIRDRRYRSIVHFASRDAMDIDGLGPAIVDQLLNEKLIATPADLYTLEFDQLRDLERMGDKSAQNLLDADVYKRQLRRPAPGR